MRHTQLAVGWKQAPEGVEAPTAASVANPGSAMVFFLEWTSRPNRKKDGAPTELPRVRGQRAVARLTSRARWPYGHGCRAGRHAPWGEFFPDSIRSHTSCRRVGVEAAGEPLHPLARSPEREGKITILPIRVCRRATGSQAPVRPTEAGRPWTLPLQAGRGTDQTSAGKNAFAPCPRGSAR